MVSSFQPSHVNPKTISYQNVPFNDESNLSVVFLFKACLAMWNVFGEYLHRWQRYNVPVLYAECHKNVTELQSLRFTQVAAAARNQLVVFFQRRASAESQN